MSKFGWTGIVGLAFVVMFQGLPAGAQQKSRIMDRSIYKSMLEANRQTGWVAFSNYGGKQLLYFTALQTLHCRLKEIRYSINKTTLDQRFPLVKCNPQNPFAMPPDFTNDDALISFEPGSIGYVAVQVVWDDDSVSDMVVYEPCKDVGEQTCAWPLQ